MYIKVSQQELDSHAESQAQYMALKKSQPTANDYIKKHFPKEPTGVQYSNLLGAPSKEPILSDEQLSCTRIALAMDRNIYDTREHKKESYRVFSKRILAELSHIDSDAKKVTMETIIEPVAVASKEQRSELDPSFAFSVQAQYKQDLYNSIEDLGVYEQTYTQDDFKRKQLLEHQNAFRLAEINNLPLICVMATREQKPFPELLDFAIEASKKKRDLYLAQQRVEALTAKVDGIHAEVAKLLRTEELAALQADLEAEQKVIKSLTSSCKKKASTPPPPPPPAR